MTSADIRAQLDRTVGLVGGFRRSTEAGMVVDLAGLDRSVEEICGTIERLPAAERPALKDALVCLLDELNALVAALETQQREISDSLKGISSRQRAVAAYGKGGAAGMPQKGKRTK